MLSFKNSSPERKLFYPATYCSINCSVTLTSAQASYDDWYIVRRFRHLQTLNCKDRYRSGFAVIRDGVSVDLARNFKHYTR